jgi:hypothetical protein
MLIPLSSYQILIYLLTVSRQRHCDDRFLAFCMTSTEEEKRKAILVAAVEQGRLR